MFFEEITLYRAGDEGYHECRIPALLTTTRGTILAFNEARKFTGRDTDQIDLFLRRSFDGGNTFEPVQVVATREGWVSGNPAPVQDRHTGTIWLLFTRNGIDGDEMAIVARTAPRSRTVWITSSDDDGASWSEPTEITTSVKRPEWTWYATGPGHGVQLGSGRLLIPCDHIVYRDGDRKTDPYHSHVIYSDDHGVNWQIGGSSDEGSNECSAVETADGWLYLNSRNKVPSASNFRRVGWSRDGGDSFSPQVRDAGLPEPICHGSVCRYTLEEEGPHGQGRNRVLFSNPGNPQPGERHHLTVRLSYDECRTWPVSRVVCQGPSSYSDLCVAPDGTICCLYERGQERGVSVYSGDIVLARFDLAWLSDGNDALA